MSRAHINLKTKLASALLQMVRPDGNGGWEPIIPYEDAKKMTAAQVVSLFQFDHGILHENGGSDEFWNLTPRLIVPHRIKTGKTDIPIIAKSRRIERAQAAHHARMDSKISGEPVVEKPRKKWPSRKIESRGFQCQR